MIAVCAAAHAGPERVDQAVDPADPARRAVLRDDGAVWVTVDAGARWTEVLAALPVLAPPDAPEIEVPELPDPSAVEDGDLDPEDYARLLREAVDAAADARAGATDQLRADADAAGADGRVWFADGRLWVVRRDGVHRTADLGVTWDEGAARVPSPLVPPLPAYGGSVDLLPLDRLVDGALAQMPGPARVRRWAVLVPRVTLVARWYDRSEEVLSVGRSDAGWWYGEARLGWGLGDVAPTVDEPEVIEVDGRWWVDDGRADPVLAAAVARRGVSDRTERIAAIHALYDEHARLACDPTAVLADQALRDAVRCALQRQEVEARLDGLSGGALSAWSTDEPTSGGER